MHQNIPLFLLLFNRAGHAIKLLASRQQRQRATTCHDEFLGVPKLVFKPSIYGKSRVSTAYKATQQHKLFLLP